MAGCDLTCCRANAEIATTKEQLKSQLSLQAAKIGQLERQLEIRVRRMHIHRHKSLDAAQEKDNAELTAICDDLVRQLEAKGM